MNIKIFKNNTQDITNLNTKLYKKYINNFLPENIVENYILEYIKDGGEDGVTVTFPNKTNGNDFEILFLDVSGGILNSKSISFKENTNYKFSISVPNTSIHLLQDAIGINSFSRQIRVINKIEVTDPIKQYITRLYNVDFSGEEFSNIILFDGIIPKEVNESNITDVIPNLTPDLKIPIQLSVGVNIYEYNSESNTIGSKISNSNQYAQVIKFKNVKDIDFEVYVNGDLINPTFIDNEIIYGKILSTNIVNIIFKVNAFSLGAYVDIVNYVFVDGIRSHDQIIRFEATKVIQSIPDPDSTTPIVITRPCGGVGELCSVINEATGENTCCPGLTCDGVICV